MAITFNSKIPQFILALQTAMYESIELTIEFIKTESQRDCPVDTGKLKSSVYDKKIPGGKQIGYSINYAIWVDYRHGNHFFRNAGVRAEMFYLQTLSRKIQEVMGAL